MKHVLQPPVREALWRPSSLRGAWSGRVFQNPGPITLELGCGRGDCTLQLALRYPGRNFVGVDIKGHRFWHGAHGAQEAGITNAAFLRAKIEFIEQYFDPGEVNEIWLTFPDPHPKDEKGTKCITSPIYLARYARLLRGRGLVHIKSDSRLLYERTLEGALAGGYRVELASTDLHGDFLRGVEEDLRGALEIRTQYERRWIASGCAIYYLQLML